MEIFSSKKVKRIIAVVICILVTLSFVIPCFAAETEGYEEESAAFNAANGLSDTQILYTVTQDGEVIQFAVFDYYDAKTYIISSDDYISLVSQGYTANEITLNEFTNLKEQTNSEIYGEFGWEKYYPDSITVTDINAIPEHAIFHDVYDMDGTLHHLYQKDGLYYDVSDELYNAKKDALLYEQHKEAESFSDQEQVEEKEKGNAIVKITCKFGNDVPDNQRLALILKCIETYEEYSLKVTPPDYSVEISLPMGTYAASECYSLLDRDTEFTVIGQNKSFFVDPEEEEKKEVVIRIGDGIRDEDFDEYRATEGYTNYEQEGGATLQGTDSATPTGTPIYDTDGNLIGQQNTEELDRQVTQLIDNNNFAPEKKKFNLTAWIIFGLFLLTLVVIFLKIKNRLEENQ